MHSFLSSLVPLILALPSVGQQSAPLPAQSKAGANVPDSVQRFAVHRNAGLHPLTEGVLRGGGEAYDVRLDQGGMYFEPALGIAAATTQHLAMTPVSVGRGSIVAAQLPSFVAPQQQDRTAIFAHAPGVRERFHVGVDGVEVSWQFDRRPAGEGDLVVRYDIDTSMGGPLTLDDGSLAFGNYGVGGVSIGGVTGVDADGNEVAGALRFVDGELEMSLPASFVDTAKYPLVLDPLVGTKFDIWGTTLYTDYWPDVSYEHTEDRYLVVFNRTFAANDIRVRGQIVSTATGLFQGVIHITGSNVTTRRPRVASCSRLSRWGVTWMQDVGVVTNGYFRSVSSVDGSLSPVSQVATSLVGTLANFDIGGEAGSFQQPHAFVTVWEDTNDNEIQARRVGYDANGDASIEPRYTVFSDDFRNTYSEPAISRATGSGQKLMVVAKRLWGIGPSEGVRAALLSARDNSVSNVASIELSTGINVRAPEVDGYGNNWVVSWTQNNVGSSLRKVAYRSVSLIGSLMDLGPVRSIGGSAFGWADNATVGYSHGKTWLSYLYSSFGNYYLRSAGIDSKTCESCADTFSESVVNGLFNQIVAVTTMSGQWPYDDGGAIVWTENSDLWMQQTHNHSNSGSVVNLGGGCGSGGTQNTNAPATGMSTVYCSVTGLSPTALLTVFNLSSTAAPVTCGPCAWLPFSFTVVTSVSSFHNASVSYAVPCRSALVGAVFETQWTTLDFSSSPCAFVPNLAISDRALHTIGL